MRALQIATVSLGFYSLLCVAAAQSKFMIRNYYPPGVNAPVFDAQGVKLAGTNYLAEVWGSANSASLAPLRLIDFGNAREIVPFLGGAGYFFETSSSDNLCVIDVPPRAYAWLQVRAWDARLGATYEQVAALGVGGYGESPMFYAQGGDPGDMLGLPAPLLGLQSFSLRPVVPEPSSLALVALGSVALRELNRRRRKCRS